MKQPSVELIAEEDDVRGIMDCEKERGRGWSNTLERLRQLVQDASDIGRIFSIVTETLFRSSSNDLIGVACYFAGKAWAENTMTPRRKSAT